MKKETKVFLIGAATVVTLTGLVFVANSLNHQQKDLEGYIMILGGEGNGTYDFNKTSTCIAPNTNDDKEYYSHCDANHIYDLKYTYVQNEYYEISYKDSFNISDDLQVYFTLQSPDGKWADNTPLAISHFPWGRQKIKLTEKSYTTRYLNIVSVYVRTVD